MSIIEKQRRLYRRCFVKVGNVLHAIAKIFVKFWFGKTQMRNIKGETILHVEDELNTHGINSYGHVCKNLTHLYLKSCIETVFRSFEGDNDEYI